MLQGPRTLGRMLKHRTAKTPDNKAIGWIENNEVKSINFAQYKNIIETLIAAFHKIGINVGDKIALLGQTSKEWHFLDMATMCSRSCLVPIYPTYTGPEITYIFNHSDSSVIIVENDKQMEKIIPELPNWKNLKLVICINELSEDVLKKIRNNYSYFSYKDLQRIGSEDLKSNPDIFETYIQNQLPEETASIIYTSGTTGAPKGAVITQHAFTTMLMNVEETVQGAFTAKDRTMVFLPLSHVLGRVDSLLPLIFGWQSVYAESMDKIIDNLAIVKPTVMIAVPRIFEKIYSKVMDQINSGSFVQKKAFEWAQNVAEKYFDKLDKDLSPSTKELVEYKLAYKTVFSKIYNRFGGEIRFFVSGGAPLAIEIIKFLRYANLTILEGYGLTETIAPCCLNPLSKQVPGTVGRPMGDVELSFGPDHEILIKSKAMMKEYYKNPEATADALKDGWLYTGDIGEFTSAGYLKITDRKKDIIITSGGKNVAPQKIENIAKTKGHISHMIVIGDKKNYLTALIGLEKERFFPILEEMELAPDCTIKEISENQKVRDLIQKEIDEVNSELAQFETIKKFSIIPIELTTDNFLTPSLKIKKKPAIEAYISLIDEMYQN